MRPKVFAIDLAEVDLAAIRSGGYNVTAGTFGQPFTLPVAPGRYYHLRPTAVLPGHTEQEIIIADLAAPDPIPGPQSEDAPPPRESSVWVQLDSGVIDPRPRVMQAIRDSFDRIHHHGGIFIFLADHAANPGYVIAKPEGPYNQVDVEHELDLDNWGCLSALDQITVSYDHGEEIEPAEASEAFPLYRHLANARFTCLLEPRELVKDRWITLATNKYGNPVAGVLAPSSSKEGEGWVIVLPRLERPGELVRELLDEVLPVLSSRLFPHAEGTRWTRREEYELPRVLDLTTKIRELQSRAREETNSLEGEIEQERKRHGYLHDLLTASGDELVKAVIDALHTLGFKDVRDVDSLAGASAQQGGLLREDLQIWDRSPTLLVEVKGIGGLPREAESLQVTKYLIPRMKEWERTDVHGLCIVNHQRALPALSREHRNVFQPDVLLNAEQQGFGLLTTWDLFRLVRGKLSNNWEGGQLRPLLYATGRVEPVPAHYNYIGQIDAYWEKASALAFEVQDDVLRVGDMLAYELPVDFVEERVESIHLDDKPVTEAEPGSRVGVRTSLGKNQAKNRTRVYRLRPQKGSADDSQSS